jgi:hypothetical protein
MTAHAYGAVRHDVEETFEVIAYVQASRRAQQLPETVNDPAVLERVSSLLRVAGLERQRDSRKTRADKRQQ